MFVRRHRSALRSVIAAVAIALTAPTIMPEAALAVGVDEAQRRVDRIVDELERLAELSDRLAEDYAEAVSRREQLDLEIAEAEVRVAEMGEQLAKLRDDLSAVAVRAYTGAGSDVLGPLFSNATVYNDSLQRDQYARVALSVGTTTADDYDALFAEYQAEQDQLERNRAEVVSLSEQISISLDQAESKRSEYQTARAEAERQLGQAIAAEERRRAEESYRRMLAEQAAQNAQNANGGGGGGGGTGGGGGGGGGGSGGGGGGGSTPAAPPPTHFPQPSSLAQVAVNAAMAQQGVPYRYASSSPGVAFDCSGLTHYAWAQAGVYLPRNSRAQFAATPRVPKTEAKPGDLLYFYNPISHVALYIGGGQLVHAPNTGSVVHTRGVNWDRVVGVTRPG
jgi:cell wall-associated NlpC family hydrolase